MKKDSNSRETNKSRTTNGVLKRLTATMWLGWYSINKKTAAQL